MNNVYIEIGPASFCLTGKFIPKDFIRRLKPFLTKKKADPINIVINFTKAPAKTSGAVKVFHKNGKYIIEREDFYSAHDVDSGSAELEIAENYLSLNSYLRIIASLALAKRKSILLHASGLPVQNKAFVFFGKSNSGKTTIIKNSGCSKYLGDEIIGIEYRNRKYYAFSTPFGGELTVPRKRVKLELGGLFSLKKSKCEKIIKLGDSVGFERLMRCIMNFSRESGEIINYTEFASRIVHDIGVYELKSKVDSRFEKIYNSAKGAL